MGRWRRGGQRSEQDRRPFRESGAQVIFKAIGYSCNIGERADIFNGARAAPLSVPRVPVIPTLGSRSASYPDLLASACMIPRPTPTRVLEVLLAVVYGAVLGTWIPVASADPVFLMQPVRVSAREIPVAVIPAPDGTEIETVGAGEGAFAYALRGKPGASGIHARARSPAGAGVDTLPAAPMLAVALPAPARAAAAPPTGRRSVIRIVDADDPHHGSGATAGARGCVSGDAGVCRSTLGSRVRALCPKPGDPAHKGPVVCIRAAD